MDVSCPRIGSQDSLCESEEGRAIPEPCRSVRPVHNVVRAGMGSGGIPSLRGTWNTCANRSGGRPDVVARRQGEPSRQTASILSERHARKWRAIDSSTPLTRCEEVYEVLRSTSQSANVEDRPIVAPLRLDHFANRIKNHPRRRAAHGLRGGASSRSSHRRNNAAPTLPCSRRRTAARSIPGAQPRRAPAEPPTPA